MYSEADGDYVRSCLFLVTGLDPGEVTERQKMW